MKVPFPRSVVAATMLLYTTASFSHNFNPFEAKTYKQCAAMGSVGVTLPGGLIEVRDACRETFPILPSLRDPNFRGAIYCTVADGKEFTVDISPETLANSKIDRRDAHTIKASNPSSDFFSSNEGLLELHPDLKPGLAFKLDINTGNLKIQSTNVADVHIEAKCREW